MKVTENDFLATFVWTLINCNFLHLKLKHERLKMVNGRCEAGSEGLEETNSYFAELNEPDLRE